MRTPLLIAAVIVGGCAATPTGIRHLPPKAVFQSAKTTPELEQCLGESRLTLLGGPSVIRGPERTSLTFGKPGIPTLLIDIEPPTITARSPYGFTSAQRRWIEGCL